MENTLPDLRVTIVESMEALALSTAQRGETQCDDARRMLLGAETLRWCAEREAPSYEEMRLELEAARESWEEAEDNAQDLVDNVRYAVSKWEHGEGCTALMIDGERACDCGMVKMRQSVLDAVA